MEEGSDVQKFIQEYELVSEPSEVELGFENMNAHEALRVLLPP